jgi:ribosomal protein S18 acetylase RimI-like enzyme
MEPRTTPSRPGQPIEVRRLADGDLEAVVALHLQCFRVRSSRRFLERAYYPTFLEPPSTGIGLVASRGGACCGFVVGAFDENAFHRVLLRRHPVESLRAAVRSAARLRWPVRPGIGDGGACLHYCAVAPDARGGGLGRRLTAELLDRLRAAGARHCSCRIYDDNAVNRRLNERLGARRIGAGRDRLGAYGIYRFDLD